MILTWKWRSACHCGDRKGKEKEPWANFDNQRPRCERSQAKQAFDRKKNRNNSVCPKTTVTFGEVMCHVVLQTATGSLTIVADNDANPHVFCNLLEFFNSDGSGSMPKLFPLDFTQIDDDQATAKTLVSGVLSAAELFLHEQQHQQSNERRNTMTAFVNTGACSDAFFRRSSCLL